METAGALFRLPSNRHHRSRYPLFPLGPRERLQGLARVDFAGEDLGLLVPIRADAAPVAHQAHGPEQIALDHDAVDAPDDLLWVDPVQHQMVLNQGARLVRHFVVVQAGRSSRRSPAAANVSAPFRQADRPARRRSDPTPPSTVAAL
jgi:hypothetical protein